ncbi:MAG: sodium:solute symporter family transporter [Acidobacteriaceae bacterium]
MSAVHFASLAAALLQPAAAHPLGADPHRLGALDLALVGIYLVGITLFGLRFRKLSGGGAPADRSLRSYFLANNTIPWWAISLSIVSAETSTLTIISIPGVAFAGNFGFLQIVIGYMIGRIVVAFLFLPRYFAGRMLTAYQLIDQRFGTTLYKITAGLFLLMRAAAEGVRVFAVSIVVGIAIGTRDLLSIAIISALTLLYTFEGGMAAVIWTDVVQMAIYTGGTVVAIGTLGAHVHGGWSAIHSVAAAAGKFHMLNFSLNLTTAYTFWAGVLGGAFLTMASHGTDQLMVQRMLAARNLRESQAALLSSGVVIFVQFALFLLIGAGLFVFYAQHPAVFSSADRIFPTFIVRQMPPGVAGLLIAAILAAAMSNLSAALNGLSSTTVVDFYVPLRPQADHRERAIVSKSSTVFWALVLYAIAAYAALVGGKGHVVVIGLSIASVAYGSLLGVFLLGTLTRFATQTGAVVGMLFGFLLNLWLWQGVFPMHLGPITVPPVAWTWYVLIGAAATFAIGALVSLFSPGTGVRRRSPQASSTSIVVLLALLSMGCLGTRECRAQAQATRTPVASHAPDFSVVSTLMNRAVATHQPPGAVVLIGHNGHVVFEHAYGDRKLAGEPGLDGQPSPALPMTEQTIFDMASLSKCLSTATAIMQLYEQGKLRFDDPVEKYLPEFNAQHDPVRAQVTLRMLLTHTSGEPGDIKMKSPWGLSSPDFAEGIHLALTTPLISAPGAVFRYSDINFILLGYMVQRLSGEPLEVYAEEHIFKPLGMTNTRYLPLARACGAYQIYGAGIGLAPAGATAHPCKPGDWNVSVLKRIAPTAHDDEGNAQNNPDFNRLLWGSVDDPSTRRMGGVAGHAGVFSTAEDVSLFAQALLDRLAGRPSRFPVKRSTLELMTMPEQPGHTLGQLAEANQAQRAAIAAGEAPAAAGLAPHYPSVKGQDLRGFGWDIDSAFSKPRGVVFPVGSFGHTGYTGTTLWMDPGSDTYIVLLANSIHPRGNPPISNLRGQVATAAAEALGLYQPPASTLPAECGDPNLFCARGASAHAAAQEPTLTGIDVVEQQHFAPFADLARRIGHPPVLGVLTNQTGIDSQRRSSIAILATDLPRAVPGAKIATIFSPEHGIFGKQDTTQIRAEVEPVTGLPVTSLYGPTEADRRPSHAQLKNLDAVVIDLQDVGVRFYTYETVTGYFLEAAAQEETKYHHDLKIIVLDRPDLIDGRQVQGPVSDAEFTTGSGDYIDFMPLPVRNGMTLGELAEYIVGVKHLATDLTIVPLRHWSRQEYFDQTGLPWVNPSPNLLSVTSSTLYPGLGLLDFSGVSAGRGTATPFELFGGAWINAATVAQALNARHIPGVSFTATTATVAETANHYPFHGQTIPAVRIALTDRRSLNAPEMGVEIVSVLHRLYPQQFKVQKTLLLLGSRGTLGAIERGEDPRAIAKSWQPGLGAYLAARSQYLLY